MPEHAADAALPPTDRGRATRDRIVASAAELVLTHGLDTLSTESVRQAASVSGSQMTHYFADKEALVRAVIVRQTDALLQFHRQPALGGLDSFEDFERWVELTLKFSARRTRSQAMPTFGALAGQLGKYDEPIRELLADGYRQWVAVLRRGLTRMKNTGQLVDEADPTALAHALISAHEGGSQLTGVYTKTWPDRDALTYALVYLRQFDAQKPSHPTARPTTVRAPATRRARV
jgi:AcrR family transcriptional regulator